MRIDYAANTSSHTLHVKQVGKRLEGTHQGDFVSRDLSGTIDGRQRAASRSAYTERHGDALSFRFTGTVAGDTMTGTLDMGEYLTAKWTAKRHDRTGDQARTDETDAALRGRGVGLRWPLLLTLPRQSAAGRAGGASRSTTCC